MAESAPLCGIADSIKCLAARLRKLTGPHRRNHESVNSLQREKVSRGVTLHGTSPDFRAFCHSILRDRQAVLRRGLGGTRGVQGLPPSPSSQSLTGG